MNFAEFNHEFSVKEFANACGVNRSTLYHYEKEGLIKPQVDEENHYRYYSTRDFYLFQYIAHLRRIGLSIQEIREYVEDRSIPRYLNALDISQQRCINEMEQLQQRYNTVLAGETTTIDAFNKPLRIPKLEFCKEEYFYTTPFSGRYSSIEALKEIRMHMIDPVVVSSPQRPMLVFRMPRENLMRDRFVQDLLMSKIEDPSSIPEDHLQIKPEGLYLHFCFGDDLITNDYEKRNNCFRLFRQYAEDHNFRITSDLYCYDLIGPFLTDHTDEFLVEFMARVDS